MRLHSLIIELCWVLLVAVRAMAAEPTAPLPAPAARGIDFAADIRPLLQKNCFSCHGPEHQEGGLRLDQRQRALDGGDSGAEIVAGKSAESRLVRVIAGIDEDFGQMPPKGKGTPFTAAEVSLVRAWIDQGAKWPDESKLAAAASKHWSLQPVVQPRVPAVQEPAWLRQPIDAFVLARQEKERFHHSPPAERTTLLRRL